jgi:hypothetical protein
MAGKKKAAGKGGKSSLVVGSKVKEAIKSQGVRMAGDLLDALNGAVGGMLKAAVGRTKANGRGTVRPQDL